VLFLLTTGRLPYDADTPMQVVKHIHDPLPLAPVNRTLTRQAVIQRYTNSPTASSPWRAQPAYQ
jgi:hypothetical protein